MTATPTIRTRVPGRADVHFCGVQIGEVRRVEVLRVEVLRERRPGQPVDTHIVWRAVPLSRLAHASTSGCPSYRTRREAAQALADGAVTL